MSHFENLANELIYEIFDYLDLYDTYNAFSNLNLRYENLLEKSILPLKINISTMSKSSFEYYFKNIIIPNQHRIISLHLSNLFIVDRIFSSLSNFTQLKTLIIHGTEFQLTNLLNYIAVLPNLSSLVIILIDQVQQINKLYHQIFRLPVLNYCKISLLKESIQSEPLPIETKEFSSIKHLVIENPLHIDELNALLSYVPQLCRLSIHQLNRSCKIPKEPYSTILKHLTHISLFIGNMTFDDFELWIETISNQLKVLHISIKFDINFLDANRWEKLIESHMPCLQIFDIWHINSIRIDTYQNNFVYNHIINQFRSPFWLERKWYFAYNVDKKSQYYYTSCFYSTDPFRRKYILFTEGLVERTCPYNDKTNIDCVRSIEIRLENVIDNCATYFPNMTELKISSMNINQNEIFNSLQYILPLQQLTTLLINDPKCNLEKIIELLRYLPKLSSLTIQHILIHENDLVCIQQNEVYQLILTRNNIKNLIINVKCGFEEIKLFVNLCPQLQRLMINTFTNCIESILRFLLLKRNTGHLSSLCLKNVSEDEIEKLNTFIVSEKLVDNYSWKIVNVVLNDMYLWW
ncbi:unnamed protein product [Adineta steineri]|uniref:F-box domain-containing protein n=1 Tax=Adineta steineri TaxID=433720 RepID=A0A814NCT9_9BILA|nr:unnamed protein product [Adineta steineri]CAF1284882.1 unnamed protein product [Adineta steineri]